MTATPIGKSPERADVPGDPAPQARQDPPSLLPEVYRSRACIEQCVSKLKRFKRVPLRFEKTAQNYGSFVALALALILVKTVHTA